MAQILDNIAVIAGHLDIHSAHIRQAALAHILILDDAAVGQ